MQRPACKGCRRPDSSTCRLVERFLLDNYKPHQLSTYALTLYRYNYEDETSGDKTPIGG